MESNPDSCQTIVENGFFLTFSNRETASQAEDIIKSQNHIRSYELLDMSVSPDTEPKQDAPDQGQDNKKAASPSAPAQTPGSLPRQHTAAKLRACEAEPDQCEPDEAGQPDGYCGRDCHN